MICCDVELHSPEAKEALAGFSCGTWQCLAFQKWPQHKTAAGFVEDRLVGSSDRGSAAVDTLLAEGVTREPFQPYVFGSLIIANYRWKLVKHPF